MVSAFLEVCLDRAHERERFEARVLRLYPELSLRAISKLTGRRYALVHRVLMKNHIAIRARHELMRSWRNRQQEAQ